MKTFLIILLVALIVYYILKYLGRFLLLRMFRNLENKMNDANSNYDNNKEGDVTIQNKQTKNHKTKDVGEYVDFEEVEN